MEGGDERRMRVIPGDPSLMRIVDPFPPDDPLDYAELSPEQQSIRVLLAVIADLGVSVMFPEGMTPSFIPLRVAEGWRLRAELTPMSDGPHLSVHADRVRLSAHWVAPPDRATGFPQCICEGRAFPHLPAVPGCVAAGQSSPGPDAGDAQ